MFRRMEPATPVHVNKLLTARIPVNAEGGPHACQRTHHVSRRHTYPLSHQHAAARRPRQADRAGRCDRAGRDLAAEIHRGVLATRSLTSSSLFPDAARQAAQGFEPTGHAQADDFIAGWQPAAAGRHNEKAPASGRGFHSNAFYFNALNQSSTSLRIWSLAKP